MADKRVVTRGQDSSTQAVVELLTSILGDVQKQVQSKTSPKLDDDGAGQPWISSRRSGRPWRYNRCRPSP